MDDPSERKNNHKKSRARLSGLVLVNQHDRYYKPGKAYDYVTKCFVADVYIQCLLELFPREPPVSMVAERAGVCFSFAKKCIEELDTWGDVVDPDELKETRLQSTLMSSKLGKIEEMCLLSLHAEEPRRPNIDYISNLLLETGTLVCSSTITNFFNRRFNTKGEFLKPNYISLYKCIHYCVLLCIIT